MATATAQDIVSLDGQAHEILKRVGNGSLEVVDVRRGLQLIIEKRLGEPSAPGRAAARFISPTAQVSNLWSWNREFGWGFTQEQIAAAAAAIPAFFPAFVGDRPLVALTLCWTLGALKETLDAKLAVLRQVYGEDKVMVSVDFKTDAKHTFLPGGAPKFVPNHIWWQVIDLGANRRLPPDRVPAAVAAGTEVFDVACQHKVYISQHDGSDTPYLDVPGIRVRDRVQGESGLYAPRICGDSDGIIRVGVHWASFDYSIDSAEPVRES